MRKSTELIHQEMLGQGFVVGLPIIKQKLYPNTTAFSNSFPGVNVMENLTMYVQYPIKFQS
jgi:hypothetical protein